jgi:ribosomal protein S3AE
MAERKKYITAKAPILNQEIRILGTPEELNNKTIKLDLTRKLRGKGLTIKLRVFNKDGQLLAVPNKMELTLAYIRRIMRKRTDYVEDSFTARCADIKATIKPLLITRKKVSRAVRKNLRNTAKEFILEYIKEKDYVQVCEDILKQELQKAMLPKLKKVYPLSFCDIRVIDTKEIENIDLEKASIETEESQYEEHQEDSEENLNTEEDNADTEEVKEEVSEEDKE